jgi:anti-sigma regulatory factor (Ser/Thr protein kinase)
MDKDMRLTVRSDPRFLGSIRRMVRGWLEASEIAEETAADVVLAIDEACSNVIRHAYEGRCDQALEISLHSEPEQLVFQISDHGEPCPPECTEKRPLQVPNLDDLKPGGLGVQLIYRVFDEVDFCPGKERGNCITMRLNRKQTEG